MLFLVMSLMSWTQTVGGCSGTVVSILGHSRMLPAGEGLHLSCQFTCLRPQHVAQLWRDSGDEDRVSLVNITSYLPNVTVGLSIDSATSADTGYYYCMTHPPDTISPNVLIQVEDKLTTPLSRPSSPQSDSTQQHSSAAGLQNQMWCWILLGKTAVLLLSLAAHAVKYK